MEGKPADTFDRISAARAEYSLAKEEKQSEEKARRTCNTKQLEDLADSGIHHSQEQTTPEAEMPRGLQELLDIARREKAAGRR